MAFFIPGIRTLWQRATAAADDPEALDAESDGAHEELYEEGTGEAALVDHDPEAALQDASEADPDARPVRTARTYAREAGALVMMAGAFYWLLALASYEADPMRPLVHGENWVGPVGEVLARTAVGAVGVVSWLVPLELVALSRPLLKDRRLRVSPTRISGDVVMAVLLAALAHIAFPRVTAFGEMPFGGAVGDLFGEVLESLFSTVGSFLIGGTVVALILVERATFSFIEVAQRVQSWIARLRERMDQGASLLSSAWAEARVEDKRRREEEARASEPLIASPEQAEAIIAALSDEGDEDWTRFVPPRRRETPEEEAAEDTEVQARPSAPNEALLDALADAETPAPEPVAEPVVVMSTPEPVVEAPAAEIEAEPEELVVTPPAPKSKRKTRRKSMVDGPTIVDTAKEAVTTKSRDRQAKAAESSFELPSTDFLSPAKPDAKGHDPERLKEMARLLEKTLLDYKVEGKVQEIHPGPTVTMFEVSPAPGTKVSKVAGLADDLALGLSRKVRIIAPIPGKNRIGFEVPNDVRLAVNLRELVESEEFMKLKVRLPTILGRDIIGRPFFADLASMPHVIVAGATGAGKSVGLNVMLVSLLYRMDPEDLRILMIDPKVVELAPFDRIPHLLFPVVTDMKQASNALKWTVDEMERRYQLFADAGTRNITTYNQWVKKARKGEVPIPRRKGTVEALAADGTQLEIPAAQIGDVDLPTKLPYIVVVVEEFADLMMTQGKEVEASVARLAQKARAAGIHVILATQRPSVDVITGMIKANFPTRIAYRVAQRVDSRTILDQQGAEALLGRGDMLVKMNGENDVKRVQCPFVSEDEVQRVTDHLRAQGEPEYDESIVKGRDEDEEGKSPDDAETDPLYDQAVRTVAETGKCSTSWLQRKLGVGYNRAAKIVETMEKNGIVGPPNGSKPREILISAH